MNPTNSQIDHVCSVYKTWQAHREHKYRVDIKRTAVATDFCKYSAMGGLLDSVDFYRFRAYLSKNRNLI